MEGTNWTNEWANEASGNVAPVWTEALQNAAPNPEDEVKAAKKHFSKLGLMFFLGTLCIYAVQLIPMVIVDMLKPELLENATFSLLLGMIPMYLVGIPLLSLLVKQVPATPIERHHMKGGHFVLAVFISYAVMIVSNVVGVIITLIIGILKGGLVENALASATDSVNIAVLFIVTVLCAPPIEEYVFRKLLVERVARYGQVAAVLFSGLMFGLFHGNLNQFVYAFTLGVFLAFLYVKTGKLKITIGIHMIVNFIGTIASVLVLDIFDFEGYNEVVQSMDIDAMMDFYMDNLVPLFVMMLFGLFVFGVVVTGIVLLIVALVKRRFTFAKGQVVLPKGKRFTTMIVNVGMILYCVFWIIMILIQLFS